MQADPGSSNWHSPLFVVGLIVVVAISKKSLLVYLTQIMKSFQTLFSDIFRSIFVEVVIYSRLCTACCSSCTCWRCTCWSCTRCCTRCTRRSSLFGSFSRREEKFGKAKLPVPDKFVFANASAIVANCVWTTAITLSNVFNFVRMNLETLKEGFLNRIQSFKSLEILFFILGLAYFRVFLCSILGSLDFRLYLFFIQ